MLSCQNYLLNLLQSNKMYLKAISKCIHKAGAEKDFTIIALVHRVCA